MAKVETDVYTFKDDVGKNLYRKKHIIHLLLNKMYWQMIKTRQIKVFRSRWIRS